ncbi:transcriptional regulator family: C2H2 zinc finger [Penicillium odoratum]|uniref:transcriptional regulator family: C2H2 zinc finger n=1 Tax=Penicillium odoratum TaxID=1167516 RepID=UPI0025491EB1|nr:transcriptional regulator family: C2H2 zinc finger [Penicillium odoratum]KAJ5746730.1 transcriptional regulator family: C2H2 zinc finger [Penicillium odoratum]
MTCDIFVSDDARNHSPQLVPQKINYGVEEEPPPFAPEAECEGTSDRSRKHQLETLPQTSLGDGVLMRVMGPGHPEVAEIAEKRPLDWSPKQGRVQDQDRFPKDCLPPKHPLAQPSLPRGKDSKEDNPQSPQRTLPLPVLSQDIKPAFSKPPQRPRLLSLTAPSSGPPIHLAPHRRTSTAEGLSPDSKQADLKSRISLPSLQSLASPPNSSVGASPDTGSGNTQTLPSISALGLSQSEFSSTRLNGFPPYSYSPSATSRNDSPHERQLPSLVPQIPPSPFSHFSPISTKDLSNNASPASQPSFWRTPTSAVSAEPPILPPPPPPPPPEPHAYERSPMTAKSPISYPTPTEPVASVTGERTSFSSHPSPDEAITNIGVYKCTHHGCTAAPFQTQYLLNSHANVHSSDRPHFCPVEGCPRGVGGKGFKRKNEMMRHGLVHNSPGYVCPFCPDQQHKYPRPDNLQRHVRVHHVDKSKDDPILRGVLAQRPIGSTRGRRRRLNG